jgi:hypothetical protein
MEVNPQWTWNDGWILMATYLTHGTDGARLHEVIAAADGINHAIPTAKELSRAFTKLVRADVAEIADDRFRLRDDLLPEIEKAYNGRGGLFESAKKGEKWLKTLSSTQNNDREVVITDDEAEADVSWEK